MRTIFTSLANQSAQSPIPNPQFKSFSLPCCVDLQEGHVRILPGHEDVLPGAFYIGIAALAGSIIARRCTSLVSTIFHKTSSHFPGPPADNFLVRWTSPLIFGGTAFAIVYPHSTESLIQKAERATGLPRPSAGDFFDWAKRTAEHQYTVIKDSFSCKLCHFLLFLAQLRPFISHSKT